MLRLGPYSPRHISRRAIHSNAGILATLETRGLLNQVTRRDKLDKLLQRPQTVYSGIDPTAKALHVGHLLPLMCLVHFQTQGHRIIPLIGGATALVGDPSGRSQRRSPEGRDTVKHNALALTACITTFFENVIKYARTRLSEGDQSKWLPACLMNNLDWYKDMSLLEFLRVAGTAGRLNTMLSRDSVQSRLNSRQGMSFTEFSYQLLQAYDFYTLHTTQNCTVQVGGQDQWGNIVAGVEMITHLESVTKTAEELQEAKGYGLTTPLLVNSHGHKMGKSEGNAIWLDPQMTSPFDLFQHFLKTPDADVEKYLTMFTLLSLDRIKMEIDRHEAEPDKRTAQHLLACEVTEMIHGAEAATRARAATSFLFEPTNYSSISAADIVDALHSDPRLIFCDADDVLGAKLTHLAVSHSLLFSNAAAKTLIAQGGLYLNGIRVTDATTRLDPSQLLDDCLVIIRAGQDKLVVLCIRQRRP